MLGHNRMTRNEFGDDVRIRIKIDASRKKNTSLRKKDVPPSPQVFRNSFNNVRSESKILSQTHTNYINRPSAKQDYTISLEWSIVNPFFSFTDHKYTNTHMHFAKIKIMLNTI